MEESALAVEKEKEAQTIVKGRLRSSQIFQALRKFDWLAQYNHTKTGKIKAKKPPPKNTPV